MQNGSSEVKKMKDGTIMDLANDYKSAASDCLKKCASLLGIAFDVYHPSVHDKLMRVAGATMAQNKAVKEQAEISKAQIKPNLGQGETKSPEAAKDVPPNQCGICGQILNEGDNGEYLPCNCKK